MLHTKAVFQGLLTLHLIGLALSLGTVGVSDLAFFRSMYRGDRITPETVSWMRFFSKIIWLGLIILYISGTGLFLLNPHQYLSSPGFLAKMVIIGVLIINALVLNFYITASLTTYSFSEKYKRSNTAWRARKLAFICGAVSTVSWYSAFFAAMFKSLVKFTFWDFIAIYGLALIGAIGTSLIIDQFLYRYMVTKYRQTNIQSEASNNIQTVSSTPVPSPLLPAQPHVNITQQVPINTTVVPTQPNSSAVQNSDQ
jgi:hypothetical protein